MTGDEKAKVMAELHNVLAEYERGRLIPSHVSIVGLNQRWNALYQEMQRRVDAMA